MDHRGTLGKSQKYMHDIAKNTIQMSKARKKWMKPGER